MGNHRALKGVGVGISLLLFTAATTAPRWNYWTHSKGSGIIGDGGNRSGVYVFDRKDGTGPGFCQLTLVDLIVGCGFVTAAHCVEVMRREGERYSIDLVGHEPMAAKIILHPDHGKKHAEHGMLAGQRGFQPNDIAVGALSDKDCRATRARFGQSAFHKLCGESEVKSAKAFQIGSHHFGVAGEAQLIPSSWPLAYRVVVQATTPGLEVTHGDSGGGVFVGDCVAGVLIGSGSDGWARGRSAQMVIASDYLLTWAQTTLDTLITKERDSAKGGPRHFQSGASPAVGVSQDSAEAHF